jgi:hypothetical protein
MPAARDTEALGGLLNCGDRFVERLFRAGDDGDVGTGGREPRRHRKANALAATGDDGSTPRKTDFHCFLQKLPRGLLCGRPYDCGIGSAIPPREGTVA